jgi:hypothetical protein
MLDPMAVVLVHGCPNDTPAISSYGVVQESGINANLSIQSMNILKEKGATRQIVVVHQDFGADLIGKLDDSIVQRSKESVQLLEAEKSIELEMHPVWHIKFSVTENRFLTTADRGYGNGMGPNTVPGPPGPDARNLIPSRLPAYHCPQGQPQSSPETAQRGNVLRSSVARGKRHLAQFGSAALTPVSR